MNKIKKLGPTEPSFIVMGSWLIGIKLPSEESHRFW